MDANTRKVSRNIQIFCIFLSFLQCENGTARDTERNIFVQRVKRQSRLSRPELKVTDFHVHSTVVSRYARTTVQSSIWNQLPAAKEATFEVDLPTLAFISNFSITSNGKVYIAQVNERGVAKKIYDEAKKRGQTAGLVSTKERESEKFRVAVTVPPGARLSFSLSYEELLPRRLGHYELTLGLRPGQLVQNLSLEVTVVERTGLSFIKALPLRTSRLLSNTVRGDTEPPPSTIVQQTNNCAHVRFGPTLLEQSRVSPKGLNADFVLQYDVELTDLMGDIQIYDGYFVHYFAPRGLPVVPKDVIFVIDTSGSMIGTKIKQTKEAMETILSDLREGDHFNIITFSDKVHIWRKDGTVKATRQNVRDAWDFVKKINADGWTNINAALLSAAQLLKPTEPNAAQTSRDRRVPLVIFLTDGEATTGVTSGEAILRNTRNAMGPASLFGLAFGDDADFPLLRRLALENRGVARMVYEDSDAALQLKGFYDEVASPLLSDIQLTYLEDQAFDVSRSLFPNYFQGSELVVAGRVKPGVRDLKVSLSAEGAKQQLKLKNDVPTSNHDKNVTMSSISCPGEVVGISSFVRRLWAYFTIKELLQAKLNSTDAATQRLLLEKATNLSLKYNFVTPVTSLVVVKPDTDEMAPSSTTFSSTTSTVVSTSTSSTTTVSTMSSDMAPSPYTSLTLKTVPPKIMTIKKPSFSPGTRKQKPTSSGKHLPGQLSTSRPTQTPHTVKPQNPDTPAQSGRISSPSPSSVSPTLPAHSDKVPVSSAKAQNRNIGPATDSRPPYLSTIHTSHQSVRLSTALPPSTDTGASTDMLTLVVATYSPIPGVTEVAELQETAVLLGVLSTIQDPVEDDNAFQTNYQYLTYDGVLSTIQDPVEEMDFEEDDNAFQTDYQYLTYDDSSPAQISYLFSSSVDGDPHFVVRLPRLNHYVCFTIDGQANDVLRLLEDPEKGIIVDGHLMWAPSKVGFEDRVRTYFDQLTISMPMDQTGRLLVTVTMNLVVVEGEGRDSLPTDKPGLVKRRGLNVTIDDHLRCWVELGHSLYFLILFHHYEHPTYLQMAHLGFYIIDGQRLSLSTQGLLGQFQHADMEVVGQRQPCGESEGQLPTAVLRVGTAWIHVTLQDKSIKDSIRKRHIDKCWVVGRQDTQRLLGHSYQSYVVDHR